MDRTGRETLDVMSSARWYNEWIFERIKPFVEGDILEIGMGRGNFTELLSRKGEVTAIDYNNSYISELKKGAVNANVGFGDVEKAEYFFTNKKFDTAVCFNVYEHIKDDRKALENTYKLLKRGGVLISIVPAHKFLFSKFDTSLGHYRRYTLKDVERKVGKVGFELIENNYLNWWAAIGWFFWFKVLRFKNMPQGPVLIFDKLGKLFLIPEVFISPPFGLSVFTVSRKP